MSTTTNPNTCPLCLSPLQGTYHHAPPGREWWTWRCLVCDPMETPAYESVETRESLLAHLAALTADCDALAALLGEARVLLNPSILRCENFHHAKKDRHEAGAECPAEVRAFALLARIDAASGG